mgnify:CR=1 FL=1
MKTKLLLSLFSLFLCHSISQNGINLIKRFEGRKLTAYQDCVGVWTIGYGTTNADKSIIWTSIYKGLKISQAKADEWLRLSINKNMLQKKIVSIIFIIGLKTNLTLYVFLTTI